MFVGGEHSAYDLIFLSMMYMFILQQEPAEPSVCLNFSPHIRHDWLFVCEPVALPSFSSVTGVILCNGYIC